MDRTSLYDSDIYAWSEQQAAVLRRLGENPRGLPNDLDLEHVAEEIESLGKGERDAAESFIRLILVHLIKLAAAPDANAARHWRAEIVNFQIELRAKLTPAMHHRIDLDRVWAEAKRQAHARLEADELPQTGHELWSVRACPIGLGAFTGLDFDVDAALARLRSDR